MVGSVSSGPSHDLLCPLNGLCGTGPSKKRRKQDVSFKSEQISKECLEVEEEAKESKTWIGQSIKTSRIGTGRELH